MAELSPGERRRKGYSLFLKRISDLTQGDIARAMGVSDGRVSELKTKHMEECIELLAHCGIKLIDASSRSMPEATFQFLTATHQRMVAKDPAAIWGEEP